jgi:hypothetical protein
MSIFENALRNKFRYSSDTNANITTEQLWDLKLATLDNIGQRIIASRDKLVGASLLNRDVNTGARNLLDQQLEVVKYVISVRQKEDADARNEAKRREEADKIHDILEKKRDTALENASEEELLKRLDELRRP